MEPHSILVSLSKRIFICFQGMLFGIFVYILFAFISYFLSSVLMEWNEGCRADAIEAFRLDPTSPTEPCAPIVVDSLLIAISWGPALPWRYELSMQEIHIISGLTFGGLGAIVFLLVGRKWGVTIFLALYVSIIILLTFFFYILAATG